MSNAKKCRRTYIDIKIFLFLFCFALNGLGEMVFVAGFQFFFSSYQKTLRYIPNSNNFTSDAARSPSARNARSIFLERSIASLSLDALTAQPILVSFCLSHFYRFTFQDDGFRFFEFLSLSFVFQTHNRNMGAQHINAKHSNGFFLFFFNFSNAKCGFSYDTCCTKLLEIIFGFFFFFCSTLLPFSPILSVVRSRFMCILKHGKHSLQTQ